MSEPSAKRQKLSNAGGDRITDPRFANIQSDPKYRLPSKKQKIKLDKRFTQKFRDDDFTKRAKVDRYGRPINNDAAQKRLMEKFDLEDEEESADELDDDIEIQKELERVEKKHDPLREGKDISSSDSESSTDEDSEGEVEEVEEAGLLQREDVPAGEVSTRIAVVNLDWDNIRAQDLMAVFSSFLPAGGRILKVSVYPSEFGRERMEREELEGPPKEIFSAQNGKDAEMDDLDEESDEQENDEDVKASMIKPDDGSEFDSQALRQYQLERLRYFYAVLIFSSKEVAKSIYDAVDGTEYLSTANSFDLRFIPEDMDFSSDKVRDECERLPTGYQPNEFVTDALQHSKVKLTWDAEDRSRKQAITRAFTGNQKEIEENDLKAYLGSDTSDSEDEVVEKDANKLEAGDVPPAMSKKAAEREKMRALLGLPSEPAKKSKRGDDKPVGNIHITFTSGLSGKAEDEKSRSVFANSPEPEETTAERYVRKEKERKQKRKEKMKAARVGADMAEDDAATEEAEVAPADTQEDELGFDDPFFNEAVNDTKQTNKIRKEQRLKKRQEREMEEAASAKQRAELELLMADDDAEAAEKSGVVGKGRAVQHFDMNEIEKAEKVRNKKSKQKHKKSSSKKDGSDRVLKEDDFKMQTGDPRLAKLFESHEFAIDPTNSQLRQTKGMKELMEETRRRKERKSDARADAKQGSGEKEKTKTLSATKGKVNGDNEVRDLVAKLKRKAA